MCVRTAGDGVCDDASEDRRDRCSGDHRAQACVAEAALDAVLDEASGRGDKEEPGRDRARLLRKVRLHGVGDGPQIGERCPARGCRRHDQQLRADAPQHPARDYERPHHDVSPRDSRRALAFQRCRDRRDHYRELSLPRQVSVRRNAVSSDGLPESSPTGRPALPELGAGATQFWRETRGGCSRVVITTGSQDLPVNPAQKGRALRAFVSDGRAHIYPQGGT